MRACVRACVCVCVCVRSLRSTGLQPGAIECIVVMRDDVVSAVLAYRTDADEARGERRESRCHLLAGMEGPQDGYCAEWFIGRPRSLCAMAQM